MTAPGARPFDGIKILDFTQVFAGPFGSYQLALLGADVIKVEKPGGEDMRFSPPAPDWAERGMAPMWACVNANKRNLTLDLKNPTAIEVCQKLIAESDVVMENFRPGVMDRLGLGYDALKQINPKIIYCAVSGFGHNGPDSQTAAYDGKIQAMSGIMSLTGHEEMGPTRAGFAVCDAIGGMTAAFAVASALYQRTHTGKGQMVDVAMLDATLAFLSPAVAEYMVAGHKQRQMGNQAVSRRPTANLFRVKHGWLLLAVNNDRQYEALLKTLGLEHLKDDPRFKTWDDRLSNEQALRMEIETVLARDDAVGWEKCLTDGGAPCASIWTIDEIVKHPQLQHRDILQTVETRFGPMTLASTGFRLEHGGGRLTSPPPQPGQHNEEILSGLGYGAAAIKSLSGI
jgi:crotonobetainyl-CoA:carnitine CoA-transferase CaiB-like acyl-CoA transferase